MRFPRSLALLAAVSLLGASRELTPEERKRNADSFEYAWSKIGENLWAPLPDGVNWRKVHDELKPKAAAASTMADARAVFNDMIARLKMTHFNIFPGDVYEGLRSGRTGSGGSPGFDVRLVDDTALVVSVDAGTPADKAGVRAGWCIERIDGQDTGGFIRTMRARMPETVARELLLTHAVTAKLDGAAGDNVPVEFLDGAGQTVKVNVELTGPRGETAKIGFLPAQNVWLESKRLGETGYVRFNMFLDPARLATQFGNAVSACMQCAGFVIDLRGNPGGIGGMAMGFASWFVEKEGVRLGVMRMKGGELKFVIFPRAEVFRGPLAILVDGLTASTSEIFAGGLQDIGRARVFGTRTAGAALPSVIDKLPNGDALQYAIADYISEGGRRLEGAGVAPDQQVTWTREALLAGRDPALDAALAWIRKQGRSQ
jgi:carboxyl-terminal processing protease